MDDIDYIATKYGMTRADFEKWLEGVQNRFDQHMLFSVTHPSEFSSITKDDDYDF